MSKFVVGIDYSLTSPAICVLNMDGSISLMHCFGKPKQQGTIGNIIVSAYPIFNSPQQRYSQLALWSLKTIPKDSIIRIEGYSYGSVGKHFQIAENCGVLKQTLWQNNFLFETVAPTAVKKYATGKGNANKELMYESFVEKTNIGLKELFNLKGEKIPSPVSDLVDAYFIAKSVLDNIPKSDE